MKKNLSVLSFLLLGLFIIGEILLLKVQVVNAAESTYRRHYIVSQPITGNVAGGSVYSNVPYLQSGWDSGTGKRDFITKALWVSYGGGGPYKAIENGYMRGGKISDGTYYTGFYVGWATTSTNYVEKMVSGFDKEPPAGHTHTIQYLGDNIRLWGVYMDGKVVANISGLSGGGTVDMGFEAFGNGDEKLLMKSGVSNLRYYQSGKWYNFNTNAKIIKHSKNEINPVWVTNKTSAAFYPN